MITWTGTRSSNWSITTNCSPNAVPTSADKVIVLTNRFCKIATLGRTYSNLFKQYLDNNNECVFTFRCCMFAAILKVELVVFLAQKY